MMSIKYVFMGTSLFIGLITMIMGTFIQETSRKGIFFGVRIPQGTDCDPELKALKRSFKKNFAITASILQILILFAIWVYPNPSFMISGAILMVAALNLFHIKTYKKVKEYKKQQAWTMPSKNIVVIDTSFRNNKNKKQVISAAWFLIPLFLSAAGILLGIAIFQTMPDTIPTHWGINGTADAWSQKSYFHALGVPIIEFFLTALMFGVYKIIARSKVQLDPENLEISKEQNRRFRYIWSCFIFLMTLMICFVFFIIHLNILLIIKTSPILMIAINILLLSTAVGAIVISFITGQGGSRLKIIETKSGELLTINRDDDDYWIFGDFYYNKDDPAFFVEKRVGVGWDFNYAKPLAKVFIVLIAAFILFICIFPLFLPIKY